MMRRALAATTPLLVAGCGGGAGAPTVVTAPAAPAPSPQRLVSTSFALGLAANASSSARTPRFIGAGGKSVTVTLTGISGASIPAGLTTSVTSTVTLPCPCTVAGPSVPAGIDTFSFTVYDGANGTGNAIASTTTTFTVALGVANSFTTVLRGVPASATLTAIPSFSAGTPASQTLGIVVADADTNVITGAYATGVAVTTNSPGGALGQQLVLNGGTPATGVTVSSSSDAVTLVYGGLATGPTSLAILSGTSGNTVIPITTTSGPIVYTGPMNGATPEVDLYAAAGAGSSGTFTLSEVGYSNAPYSRSFGVTAAASCVSIATVALTTPPATYTVTAAPTPVAGTCQIFAGDVGPAQQLTITVTYTGNSVGVQSRRSTTPR